MNIYLFYIFISYIFVLYDSLSMNLKHCYLFCCWYCSSFDGCKFYQVGSRGPSTCLHSFGFFEHFHIFWHYKMLQTHLKFLCFNPRINHSAKALWFFCWEWYLEIKIWVLGVLVASGVSLPWGLWADSARKHMCAHKPMNIYVYSDFHIHSSVSITCQLSEMNKLFSLYKKVKEKRLIEKFSFFRRIVRDFGHTIWPYRKRTLSNNNSISWMLTVCHIFF